MVILSETEDNSVRMWIRQGLNKVFSMIESNQ